MIRPQRAAVRPRVYTPVSKDALLLEDEVARFVDEGAGGLIAVLGPPGSGKTTALRHLASVLLPTADVLLLGNPGAAPMEAPVRLVVYTAPAELPGPHLATYRL